MAKIIQHQLFYPHPPQLVWDYITQPELMAKWLMPGNIKPEVGHEFTLTAKPMPEMDFDGVFYCTVLEAAPFKKLSYTWKFGPGDGNLYESVVDWTLTEKDNGTELLLVHRGFENGVNLLMFTSMEAGWLQHITKILTILNTQQDGAARA